MQILIHKDKLKLINNLLCKNDFEMDYGDSEFIFDIKPTQERDVHERYLIQYGDADDNENFIQLFTNGFAEDKLIELMRYIKQYVPQFEWIEEN